MAENILEVHDLEIRYVTDEETVQAVNDITFSLERGESIGLVGETGAGKTTTALSILKLIQSPPGRIKSGKIFLGDQELTVCSDKEMQKIRGKRLSMIFQDPMTALNPVITVGNQIAEVIRLHEKCSRAEAEVRASEMLEMVGIPAERFREYPHQFSGGMKQRVVIAIALACMPELLIADEPTTALDVTIQAQILDLIRDLNQEMNTSVVFITHDLGVVSELCDTVIVMYNGHIVEKAPTADIFREPLHPYTQGLLSAIPRITKERKPLSTIEGMVPNPVERIKGCRFWPRCPKACDRCRKEEPPVFSVGEDRQVRCWLYAQADNGSQEAVTNG